METVSEEITFFAWDGDVLVQEIQPHKSITYLYEPDSFTPLAQVHSDTPDSEYDVHTAQAKREQEAAREAQEEDEAEKLKWLKVTDKAAYEHAVQTIEARKQKERQDEFALLEAQARNDRIYYVNADHLGTPQEVVSEDGKVVWLARYKAWGRIHRLDVSDIAQPFRFQGQYEDEETGLFYNRFRYYDPDAARYLTQDPIRLLGGENLNVYAPNPTGWVDPLGLSGRKEPKPWIPPGNEKEGWQHIDERHISGTHSTGPGDLFQQGTTQAQIQAVCECLVKKGTRISDSNRRIQTYEKRMKVNGKVDRVRGVFDSQDGNRTITVFPVRSE